jgi:hypothetical protein
MGRECQVVWIRDCFRRVAAPSLFSLSSFRERMRRGAEERADTFLEIYIRYLNNRTVRAVNCSKQWNSDALTVLNNGTIRSKEWNYPRFINLLVRRYLHLSLHKTKIEKRRKK